MVVESYKLYDWRKCLSTRQGKLSSGEMLSLRGLRNFAACDVSKRPRALVRGPHVYQFCRNCHVFTLK